VVLQESDKEVEGEEYDNTEMSEVCLDHKPPLGPSIRIRIMMAPLSRTANRKCTISDDLSLDCVNDFFRYSTFPILYSSGANTTILSISAPLYV
jgi:hypothetical protein